MRIFGAERIKSMMGRFGIPEDQPIDNRFISSTLEGAQKKIEGFHFDSRKHTLEYDDVMNHQRNIVYSRRRKMLDSDAEVIEKLLESITLGNEEAEKIVNEKRQKLGDEAFFETVRRVALYTNDILWMEHLEAMDYLRSSVNLRAYGQREPLVEYKKEGLKMFKEMEEVFKEQVLSMIENINTDTIQVVAETPQVKQTLVTNQEEVPEFKTASNETTDVGRNDPCPCGAINPATMEVYKWKKCGMINAPQHRKALMN